MSLRLDLWVTHAHREASSFEPCPFSRSSCDRSEAPVIVLCYHDNLDTVNAMSEKTPPADGGEKAEPVEIQAGDADKTASDVEAVPQPWSERVPWSQRRGLFANLQIF